VIRGNPGHLVGLEKVRRNPCSTRTKFIHARNHLWHAITVTHLQQELVAVHKMRDDKLAEIQRQTEDAAAAQQAAFDQKVSSE